MGDSPSFYVTNPVKFSGHAYCGSGDIIVLNCHIILKYHGSKGLCDLMGGNSSW